MTGLQQKFRDLTLLIKTDRRLWAAAAVIAACLVSVTFMGKDKKGLPPIVTGQAQMPMAPGEKDASRDLLTVFKDDLVMVKNTVKQIAASSNRDRIEFREHQNRAKGIFEQIADRLDEVSSAIEDLEAKQTVTQTAAVQPVNAQPQPPDGLDKWGDLDKPDVPLPPPAPKPIRASVITPGDAVCLKLLTGVHAPVDGTPYPVVFKLTCPITGPDGASLDLGEARLIAAAQGSEADGRVLYRLTDLAIRHSDGRRQIVPVDGWIVGEDGIRGMKGELIDKLGRLIVATAGVSFAAALGDRLDSRANNNFSFDNSGDISIDSNDVNSAGISALTDASNRLGQLLLDRYEKLVPVVRILSGREVMAVFSAPAEIEVIDETDEEGFYASLD